MYGLGGGVRSCIGVDWVNGCARWCAAGTYVRRLCPAPLGVSPPPPRTPTPMPALGLPSLFSSSRPLPSWSLGWPPTQGKWRCGCCSSKRPSRRWGGRGGQGGGQGEETFPRVGGRVGQREGGSEIERWLVWDEGRLEVGGHGRGAGGQVVVAGLAVRCPPMVGVVAAAFAMARYAMRRPGLVGA